MRSLSRKVVYGLRGGGIRMVCTVATNNEIHGDIRGPYDQYQRHATVKPTQDRFLPGRMVLHPEYIRRLR